MCLSQEPALFIVFEGVDGAGKTTQLDLFHHYLTECGIDVVKTREPGGTPIADRLRECLLERHDESVSPMSELLMLYAARQQHLDHVIRPALANGQWVLCDRFIDTTYAYQIRGRRLVPELFHQFNRLVVRDTFPDITVFFSLDEDIRLKRLQSRIDKQDRLDGESALFTQRAIAGLKERAQFGGHVMVDASGTIDQVARKTRQAINARIEHMTPNLT